MRPMRVLLVDDSEDMRLLIRTTLDFDPEFEVCGEAGDGEEAIALVESSSPDVIVLDLVMPVMDGLTALPILREKRPCAPVIVLTASATPEGIEEALRRGAHSVLSKGEVLGPLKDVLREACSTSSCP